MAKSKERKVKQQSVPTVLEKLDAYFSDKEKVTLWLSLGLMLLFSLLLFEPKVSIGGDDSMYINRGYNFIKNGTFPAFQGPLYPMVLGLIIAATGMNLIILKFFSLLCLLGFQWFTFRMLRHHLPPFILFMTMILTALSASILYYGSATYSEAFYMLLQAVFLYHFDKSFIRHDGTADLKKDWKKFALSAFLMLLLALTKNIGLIAIIAVAIYFALSRQWKAALIMGVLFTVFMLSFKVIKAGIWDVKEAQIANQGSTLMMRHPYDKSLGKEDAYGFLMRLASNSKVYLGHHFWRIYGMSPETNYMGNAFAAIVVIALLISGFLIFYKKNRFWLFLITFTGTGLGTTFLVLQTYWNQQERLIIIFTPLLLACLLFILHHLFTHQWEKLSAVFMVFLVIMFTANFIKTFKLIPDQVKIISKYMQGEKLYGFPEDWVNYPNMAKWTADNLPPDAFVGCRKPGMAFIYSGGKNFYGIWRVPSSDPEDLYMRLKNAGVTHVIVASLRTNPKDPNSPLINTVARYLSAINKAYPGKLTMVHKVGDDWPAYLYKLD